MDVAGPGQHVYIPATFSTDARSTVTRLVLEVTFSEEKLLYGETLPGAAVESNELKIEASFMDLPDEGAQERLRVEISSTQGLPPGELLRISFRISEDAELNEDIIVKNVLLDIETSEGEDPQVTSSDGTVAVIANAFFACFFYTH